MDNYTLQEDDKPTADGQSTMPDYNITEEDFLIYPYLDDSGIVRYVVIVSDYLGRIVNDIVTENLTTDKRMLISINWQSPDFLLLQTDKSIEALIHGSNSTIDADNVLDTAVSIMA